MEYQKTLELALKLEYQLMKQAAPNHRISLHKEVKFLHVVMTVANIPACMTVAS